METVTTEHSPEPVTGVPTTQPATPPAAAEATVQFLQVCLGALGAAMILVSVFFNLYLYKQNNLLIAQLDTQTRMLNLNEPLFESNSKRLSQLVQDLGGFAQQHPDLVPLLVKYKFVRVQAQTLFNSSSVLPANP